MIFNQGSEKPFNYTIGFDTNNIKSLKGLLNTTFNSSDFDKYINYYLMKFIKILITEMILQLKTLMKNIFYYISCLQLLYKF